MLTAAIAERRNDRPGTTSALDANSPWIALDRFIRELENGQQVSDRFPAALDDHLRLNDCPARLHQYRLGQPKDRNGRCRDSVVAVVPGLTRGLAARFPRGGPLAGGRWRRGVGPPSDPIPHSAVILPIEAPWPCWMVAVSLDPDGPLEDSDLRIIQVIWRLQVATTATSASTKT